MRCYYDRIKQILSLQIFANQEDHGIVGESVEVLTGILCLGRID